ncbi:MAG TPA: amidohydrolase [Telluria sp.]|nr:amidohydrolase [Telluria sp.]
MRPIFLQCSLAVLSALGTLAHAGTVIENANGYTLNAKNELVQFTAMAIDDHGKIIAVGTAAEVAAKAPGAQRVDLGGKTVIPGLIDAHGHVFGLGDMLTRLDLSSTATLPDALAAITAYAKANPGNAWLQGRGWNQEIWKLGRFPTAAELDAVVADRPAWFERVDGHAGWANSRALQLAGITDATRDPVGGKIMRDANGKATGVLVDAAMDLVNAKVPRQTEADLGRALDTSLAEIARMGLTSVHDAGMGVAEDKLYREYASAGKLTARVYAMIGGVGADFDRLAQQGPLKTFANDMYALRSVKLYSDGALGSRGAALIAPYSDDKHTHGLLFNKDGEMNALIAKAMKKGYQVNVHAIGDAGNRQVLNAFADQTKKTGTANLRHRIEHAQVVTPADIARFRTVGIIPSMQPTHATSDMNMAEKRVGPDRIKGAYAWRTFLHQGSKVACGSDFPVESPNPFYGIHAAVTRQDARAMPVGGWYPEQAMSLKEALRCFTLDAAHAAHQENMLGSLEPGKWADFIVIDRDLFRIPAYDLYKTGVLQTWVAGRQVFGQK